MAANSWIWLKFIEFHVFQMDYWISGFYRTYETHVSVHVDFTSCGYSFPQKIRGKWGLAASNERRARKLAVFGNKF